MIDTIFDPFIKAAMEAWGIICWLARAWFGIIYLGLKSVGWVLFFVSTYFIILGQTLFGGAIFFVALVFLATGEVFSLLSFWLSEQKYTIPPEKFIGDVFGSTIGFVMLFGLLFAFWFFFYPERWFVIVTIAFMPIIIIDSLSRFMKNFLAMTKDKLSLKKKN